MRKSIMHVGLDVHKDSVEIATADQGRDGEVRRFGKIGGDLASLDKAVRKLQSSGRKLQFVYEAVRAATRSIATSQAKAWTAKWWPPRRLQENQVIGSRLIVAMPRLWLALIAPVSLPTCLSRPRKMKRCGI